MYGFLAGESRSPEIVTRRNADMIVQALYAYRSAMGTFPTTLSELEPAHLEIIPRARTTQETGWLFEGSDDHFVLGYWYGPDKFGSTICLFRSSMPAWECQHNGWGPFPPVPTPFPTLLTPTLDRIPAETSEVRDRLSLPSW